MDTTRKVQLSAAAVIANGVLALSLMSPPSALADSCESRVLCGVCSGNPTQDCQNAAPGCTVTFAICSGSMQSMGFCIWEDVGTLCGY